jgi:hypothetical protein
LDHCYSTFRNAYKVLHWPPFGKSDHDSILLLPSYRQKLKQEVPVLRSIQRWSDQLESMLEDCFGNVDWDMFRVASENNIEVLLQDKLNTFFSRIEDNTVPPTWPATKDCGFSFSVADV